MKDFHAFAMERYMSAYEQQVDFNLSESGVQPMLLSELLDLKPGSLEDLMDSDLNYPHVDGRPELREKIAALYTGAESDNVLVTVGAIEANYNVIRTLLQAGEEIVIMQPNYMQIWGIAKNHGLRIKTFRLLSDDEWKPDLAGLDRAVGPDTRLIAVCNPNNPTGYILSDDEMREIVRIAGRVGAWILSDEVYRGVEQAGESMTPSFYGMYDRVMAIGSMSKAYGLPGLRTGWVVCSDKEALQQIWARHEYNTISTTMLANRLADLALSDEARPQILARSRQYVRRGFSILSEWMEGQPVSLTCVPPSAAAIAWVHYDLDVNSTELAMQLIGAEPSLLIVPGDHFGMDTYLRISFGLEEEYLRNGLAVLSGVFRKLSR